KRLRSSSTSTILPSPCTPTTSTCTRATSTTRNSSGAFSANSMLACTTTLSRCSPARPRTGPSTSGKACEPAPENRGGNPSTRPPSFFPLHGDVPLRSGTGLLRGAHAAVRQSRRLLHLQRCARRLRPAAGAAVRRNVASTGVAAVARGGGTGPGTGPVCPGCAGLVREEVSRILSRFALHAGRGFARAAPAGGGNSRPTHPSRQSNNLFLDRGIAQAAPRPHDCFRQRTFRCPAG